MAAPLAFLGSALLSWFAGLFGRFLSDSLLRFVAYKLLFFALLTTTFPIVIKNLIVWVFDEIISATSSFATINGIDATVLSLTGAAGYLASQLMLADCISILMTACIIRFTLNFIPLVG